MKVLLISNQVPNSSGVGNPIVLRMRDALDRDGRIEKVMFKPFYNSLKSILSIRKATKEFDVVHVQFGGLYALIIYILLIGTKSKKLVTFHGTDIHAKAIKTTQSKFQKLKILLNQKASFMCALVYDRCGVVAAELVDYIPAFIRKRIKDKIFHQKLGVDYSLFTPMDKDSSQKFLGLENGHYILFSDVSNTSIKRRDIASEIVRCIGEPFQLLVMSGVKPTEVPYYINACEFALLTSDEEGSPNIIREVLALNKPFFSVDVGDAAKQLAGLTNSCIISRDPRSAADTIKDKLNIMYIDDTRERMKDKLDFVSLTGKMVDIYHDCIYK